MKPGFHVTIALWYLLKFPVLGSWCDDSIMIYFETSSFSKLASILQSNWHLDTKFIHQNKEKFGGK